MSSRPKTKAMKLRFPFPALQLLSAFVLAATPVLSPRPAAAQAPAQAGADYVVLKAPRQGVPPMQLTGVTITMVRGTKVSIRNAQGEIAYDLAQIQEVRKNPPAELAQGRQFIEAGAFDKALPLVKSVVDRFKGLPVTWASEACATLGNLYISLGQLPEAEIAFADLEKSYPGAGGNAASLGKARLAAERGKLAEARTVAEPIVADALGKKSISRAESQLYGQAYYILGKVAEGENKLPEAMEHYCRVVAIFYQERAVVKEAQKRIDELRQKGITTP